MGGWQVSGTVFWHTGFPFSVTDYYATQAMQQMGPRNDDYPGDTYSGYITAVPLNRNMNRHCGREGIQIVLTGGGGQCLGGLASFTDPTGFGAEAKNQYSGPGFFNTDMALLKTIHLRWHGSQFLPGAQFYNILNHPNFTQPNADLIDGAAFGQISGTVGPPTSVYGSGLGISDAARIIQFKGNFVF